MEKVTLGFRIYIKYGKFLRVSPGHFIKQKLLFSEEWLISRYFNTRFFRTRLYVRHQQNPKFSSPKAQGAVLDPDLNVNREVGI